MNYEIFSYGNVDALMGLFNALAAIMNGNVFLTAIGLVFVVGFFGAFLGSALAPDRLMGPKWLMSVVLIYLVLFLPKATVQVVDKTGNAAPAVIDNVPLGLAFQASIVSSVSNTLTDLFETALQVLPPAARLENELSFSNHGLMFGAHLVERSRAVGFTDAFFRADLMSFIQNCTFYDVSQGLISAEAFAASTDLWALMATTNPARFASVTDPVTGIAAPAPCPVAYAQINNRMPATVGRLLAKLGIETNPALQLAGGPMPAVAATAAINAQLPAAYVRTRIANAATTAAEILQQNAMINAVQEANLMMSQQTEDPSATLLGVSRAQAVAQLNAQQITGGRITAEALPLVRNSIEAVLYGIFPFVLLLAILFGGVAGFKLLKSYGMGLIWLSLWPPIYAIINYLGTLAWAKSAASGAYLAATNTTGLALLTASPVYSNTVSAMASVGNLVMAVPVIAAAVVFGLNKIAAAASGFTMAASSAAGPISNQAVSGNINQGHVSFLQQQLDPNRSSAHMNTFSDLRGSTQTDSQTGDVRYRQNAGSSVVGIKSLNELATRNSEASEASHARATDLSRQADHATSTGFDRVLTHASSTSTGTAGSAGYAGRQGAGQESAWSKATQIRDQLARDLGISDRSSASSATSLALGFGMPGKTDSDGKVVGAIKSLLPVKIAAGGDQLTSNDILAAVRKARSAAEDAGITDAGKLVDDYTKSEDFRRLRSTNREEADRIAAASSDAYSLRASASAAYRESEAYRQSAEAMRSMALRGELDWVPEFNSYLARHGALGVTGQEALMWAERFFRETGVGIGADGQPKAVLFDGAGPGHVTVTPGSYRDPNAQRRAYQNDPLVVEGEAVTAERLATRNLGERVAVRMQGTGEAPGVPASEDDLRFRFDQERFVQSVNRDNAQVDAEAGRQEQRGQFDEAAENISPTHVLGWQWDGRSAKQQLEAAQEQEKGATRSR